MDAVLDQRHSIFNWCALELHDLQFNLRVDPKITSMSSVGSKSF